MGPFPEVRGLYNGKFPGGGVFSWIGSFRARRGESGAEGTSERIGAC